MGATFIRGDARITAAKIAGDSSAMDGAALAVKMAVTFEAARHIDTGAYIRRLSIENVPGEFGTGRGVRDRLVVANDPGSAAIEWGHWNKPITVTREGRRASAPGGLRYVPGMHPMGRGLARVEGV